MIYRVIENSSGVVFNEVVITPEGRVFKTDAGYLSFDLYTIQLKSPLQAKAKDWTKDNKKMVDVWEGDLLVNTKGIKYECIFDGIGFKLLSEQGKVWATSSVKSLRKAGNVICNT